MAWPGRRDGWRLRLVRARAAAFEGRGRLAGRQAGTAMERQSQPRRPIDERPAGRVERERHASLFRRLRVDRLTAHPLLSLVGGVGCFLFPVTLLSPQSLMSHYLSAPVVRRRHPLRRSISQSHGLCPVPQDKFPSRSAGVHRHSNPLRLTPTLVSDPRSRLYVYRCVVCPLPPRPSALSLSRCRPGMGQADGGRRRRVTSCLPSGPGGSARRRSCLLVAAPPSLGTCRPSSPSPSSHGSRRKTGQSMH